MKISHDDRLKIKLWLEKDPSSEEKGKSITINDRLFHRRTEYFGEWKVRIAYDAETNYPLLMSSPIPAEQDSNKQNVAPKVMVAKLPKKAAPKKPALSAGVAKPSAFQAAVEIEVAALKKKKTEGYVTFKLHPSANVWEMPVKPKAVTMKAVKGSKAIYSGWSTYYVLPNLPIPYKYWKDTFKQATVPVGYYWMNMPNSDALTLVKK